MIENFNLSGLAGIVVLCLCLIGLGWYFVAKRFVACRRRSLLIENAAKTTDRCIVIFAADGALAFINDKAASRLSPHVDIHKITAKKFLDFLYDHAVAMENHLQNVMMPNVDMVENLVFREFVRFGKDGYFLATMRHIKDDGQLFLLDNISLNKKREEKLSKLYELNHRMFLAIEASTCGILIGDFAKDGHPVVFLNNALCDILGLERAAIVDGSVLKILDVIEDPHDKQSLADALAQGHAIELESSVVRGGVTRWFNVQFSIIDEEKAAEFATSLDMAELALSLFVVTDTTLLKQRETEIFQSQKLEALGQLAAGIAHDFNNILSIVDGYSQMGGKLLEGEGNQDVDKNLDKVRDYLKKISASSKRGAALTQKMLTFSRHKVASRNVIDLREVLVEQKDLLMPLLGSSINFDMRLSPEEIYIKAKQDMVGQIIMNLCINARDAMPDGGNILLDAALAARGDIPEKLLGKLKDDNSVDEFVRVSVTDYGTGMDQKTIDRIFDPFFTTKQQGKGTGLGLSVVYGLVQEMGGVIDVKSQMGFGTQMIIYLPLSKERPTKKIKQGDGDGQSIRLDGYTILVAEDEPELLETVKTMLEGFGMKVIAASCADEALVKQDEFLGEIDILLTDVVMPETNGVKLAELMQALRPDIKILFMSGYPANGDMAPVELPKGAIFMAKPMDYQGLAKQLMILLNKEKLTNIKVDEHNDMQQWIA